MGSGVYSGYNPYGKNLARQKQRRFFIKIATLILLVFILIASTIYLLFYSYIFRITQIDINGLNTVESAEILSIIETFKNESIFGKLEIRPQLNILFFDHKYIREKILNKFTVIGDVDILKEYPHKIVINIHERLPLGTWCFGDSCSYFDDSGTLWGNALKSTGTLLLTVNDYRKDSDPVRIINKRMLTSIMRAINEGVKNDIKTRHIEIPEGTLGDFKLHTLKGYYIIMNVESDIIRQMKILKIFLEEKSTDFSPVYIDLRIGGRIYYK